MDEDDTGSVTFLKRDDYFLIGEPGQRRERTLRKRCLAGIFIVCVGGAVILSLMFGVVGRKQDFRDSSISVPGPIENLSDSGTSHLPQRVDANHILIDLEVPYIDESDLEAALDASRDVMERRRQLEGTLRSKGFHLRRGSPSFLHHQMSGNVTNVGHLINIALIMEAAAKYLKTKFNLTSDQAGLGLQQLSTDGSELDSVGRSLPMNCGVSAYRTADGSCNNLHEPTWGKSQTVFPRLLPPYYEDGISSVRLSVTNTSLPSARVISTALHTFHPDDDLRASHLLMGWGQFVDHDVTKTAPLKTESGDIITCCAPEFLTNPSLLHPDCLPIQIPTNDSFYSRYNYTCMEFVRSSPGPRTKKTLGAREQLNLLTSYLDGSGVYGSTETESIDLRTFGNGFIRFSNGTGRMLLPLNLFDPCCNVTRGQLCYLAGDSRVNMQPILTSIHTLWLRQHNRLAAKLKIFHTNWSDERLYQEARKIVAAQIQHITYNEFLPIVLGPDVMESFGIRLQTEGYFSEYDQKVNPSITNVFASAAFRFGHSMVQGYLELLDGKHKEMKELFRFLFRPSIIQDGGLDSLTNGASTQSAKHVDRFITEQLTNHLFQGHNQSYGLDLISITIQRGRDHGLAPYNSWRKLCQLKRIHDFDDMDEIMDETAVPIFKKLYQNVEDVDLYPAGLAEIPLRQAMVGPTFACIIGTQFSRLRRGDRFWYENGQQPHSFTPDQLQEIRKTTLARIICDNSDSITKVHLSALLQVSNSNLQVSCNDERIPTLDLKAWNKDRNS